MGDVAALINEARAAGLTLQVCDGRLVIRGPKDAEPIVERLRACKRQVIELLKEASRACSTAVESPTSDTTLRPRPSTRPFHISPHYRLVWRVVLSHPQPCTLDTCTYCWPRGAAN
jgi:hypothetical protein